MPVKFRSKGVTPQEALEQITRELTEQSNLPGLSGRMARVGLLTMPGFIRALEAEKETMLKNSEPDKKSKSLGYDKPESIINDHLMVMGMMFANMIASMAMSLFPPCGEPPNGDCEGCASNRVSLVDNLTLNIRRETLTIIGSADLSDAFIQTDLPSTISEKDRKKMN